MELMDPQQSYGLGRSAWYESHGVSTGINWYAEHPEHFAGNPTGATAEYGEALLNYQAQNLAEVLRKIKNDDLIPNLFDEFYSKMHNPEI